MRCLTTLVLLLILLAFGGSREARAQWCAQYDMMTYTCGFPTLGQCLATISGIGGDCRRDYLVPRDETPRKKPPRRQKQKKRAR